MSSAYCSKSNIVDIFNLLNTERWSDAAGDAATIATRIARAIDVASDEIDDELRSSPYLIPIVSPDGTVPTAIVDIAAKLAGVWLYEGKGVEDRGGDKPVHRLSSVKGEAHLALANIRTGKRRINAL
ncbi:MAG: phage protein Gp36 family protein [Chloroflexota bacterium]|nr:phage protein Gp36 family protein [Chloroflexota bacterium]